MPKNTTKAAKAATPNKKQLFATFLKSENVIQITEHGFERSLGEKILCAAENRFATATRAWAVGIREMSDPMRGIENIINLLADVCSDLDVISQTFPTFVAVQKMEREGFELKQGLSCIPIEIPSHSDRSRS